ncbi:MAG: 3'-5' exonuclease [Treponema sp.]|nr:3'-5' exonuclease [Treponema sp.]
MQHQKHNIILSDIKKLFRLYNDGMTFVAFDTETTGLHSSTDRILEIGAVKFNKNGELGIYSELINPLIPIPKIASDVNHITDMMVKDKPCIKDILPSFVDFISGTVLIAHNAPFDLYFVNAELERNGFKPMTNDAIDTLTLSRSVYPDFERHKLQYLAERLNINVQDAHRAFDDARVCKEIFIRMVTK